MAKHDLNILCIIIAIVLTLFTTLMAILPFLTGFNEGVTIQSVWLGALFLGAVLGIMWVLLAMLISRED